jgi:hypothetical protein
MGGVRIISDFPGTLPLIATAITSMVSLVMDPERWQGQQHTGGLRCF